MVLLMIPEWYITAAGASYISLSGRSTYDLYLRHPKLRFRGGGRILGRFLVQYVATGSGLGHSGYHRALSRSGYGYTFNMRPYRDSVYPAIKMHTHTVPLPYTLVRSSIGIGPPSRAC